MKSGNRKGDTWYKLMNYQKIIRSLSKINYKSRYYHLIFGWNGSRRDLGTPPFTEKLWAVDLGRKSQFS